VLRGVASPDVWDVQHRGGARDDLAADRERWIDDLDDGRRSRRRTRGWDDRGGTEGFGRIRAERLERREEGLADGCPLVLVGEETHDANSTGALREVEPCDTAQTFIARVLVDCDEARHRR